MHMLDLVSRFIKENLETLEKCPQRSLILGDSMVTVN